MLASAAPVSRRACTPGPGAVTLARAPARGCQRRPFSPDADGRPKTGCRRLPLACQPSRYTSARPGMTHRDGQSMRRRIKSTYNAEYARSLELVDRRWLASRSSAYGLLGRTGSSSLARELSECLSSRCPPLLQLSGQWPTMDVRRRAAGCPDQRFGSIPGTGYRRSAW